MFFGLSLFFRGKRVFGTIRCTNVPVKTIAEKPVTKPTDKVCRPRQKASREALSKPRDTPSEGKPVVEGKIANENVSSPAVNARGKNSSGETKSRSKKNVCFQEPLLGSVGKTTNVEVHTPVRTTSSALSKPRVLGTPYHSAENCSKCRLHRLESSSYWLAQIKLAESVEKHFVAETFFRLAQECKAEPVRGLRMELRRYLARHTSLSTVAEWKSVSINYGLLKGESNVPRIEESNAASLVTTTKNSEDTNRKNDDGTDKEQKNHKNEQQEGNYPCCVEPSDDVE
ncbi:hypothetical protein IFM89_035027 [Coptis chinensis]|uniref:Uncharacterized protein n=1 Tax=Coptis chinensis TaxID=261450 RepID=A0A835LPJ5_9MAGN|nr:hypothetical protein IFM89_035027 [Coptis chinensis]